MKVIVVGGGASGMMAALVAAQNCHSVTLIEQNEKLGKKLYITGKGRCNLTNLCDRDLFFSHIIHNQKFFYSAYNAMNNDDTLALFNSIGLKTKTERGGRVFPDSDKSSDVIKALQNALTKLNVNIMLNTKVKGIDTILGRVSHVSVDNGEKLDAQAVILASGGVSYPQTGSTGDGHGFLRELGHTVFPLKPSLVPFETVEKWPFALTGLALKNVKLTAFIKDKKVFEEQGEMLFAHFGVTGPLVLSASAAVADNPIGTELFIDLKPALTAEQLDKRLQRDLAKAPKMTLRNAFSSLLPYNLLQVIFDVAGIDPMTAASEFTKKGRQALIKALKYLPLNVSNTRSFNEAIITRGGVNVKEINPATMESKLVNGLYVAGELLDVDGTTGGFNLQIAWSTGALAGMLKD